MQVISNFTHLVAQNTTVKTEFKINIIHMNEIKYFNVFLLSKITVRIDGPRGGELDFLFIFKTLMRNLNKVNLHNSRSPNSPNAS
jgi:hypothetical protein